MKKFISILSAVVLTSTLFLSGCSTTTPEATPAPATPTPAPAETQTETPAPADTTTPATSDVVLSYWSMWNEPEPQGTALKQAIQEFTAQTGIKVDISWQGREIRTTLQPALDAGTKIDIFDEELERVIKTWGNYILPIDEYVEKEYPTTDGKPYKDVVNSALINLAKQVATDGKLYGVPYQPFMFTILYNEALFEQAGITSTPKTWAEFLDVCQKLKDAGITPITVDNEYVYALPGYHLARLIGPDAVQDLVNNRDWDNPALLQTAKDWEDMYKKGFISEFASSNIWPTGQQEIAQGTTAMYLNGTWLPNEIAPSTGPDFRWGAFAYPEIPGGVTGAEAANFSSQFFAINKTTQYPEEAMQLMVFLTTGKWDSELAAASMGIPVGKNSEWPKQLAAAKPIFDNLKTWYPWSGGIQANVDASPVIASAFSRLIGGTATAEQFIAELKQ